MRKKHLALLLVSQAMLCYAQSDNEIVLTEYTDMKGITSVFTCSRESAMNTPAWTGGLDEPPFPVLRAIDLAKEWVKKKEPKINDLQTSEISIRRIWHPGISDRWYYMLEMNAERVHEFAFRAYVVVVLLMDGTIIEPVRKAPSGEQDHVSTSDKSTP